MNRFFDIRGDVSTQLAPWTLRAMGLDPSKAQFELREPIRFRSDIAGGVIEVPNRYVSDLASIPQFAWSIFMAPDDPRIELGASVHDYLYEHHGEIFLEFAGSATVLTRQECDEILTHEAMVDLGANEVQRDLVYQILRRCGDQWPGEGLEERLQG